MIYTTGGMRVARVSLVDGSGTEVFDELVRMDPGVEVMCVPQFPLSCTYRPILLPATISPGSLE